LSQRAPISLLAAVLAVMFILLTLKSGRIWLPGKIVVRQGERPLVYWTLILALTAALAAAIWWFMQDLS
jgi:hypothetical protein